MKWLVLTTLWLSWTQEPRTVEVRVRTRGGGGGAAGGAVRGAVRGARTTYHQYLGIPYAYTDREHRFQAPLPHPGWGGVFDAVDEHVKCLQHIGEFVMSGQENCLTLHIYTPLPEIDQLRPVMVMFHGGGYFQGSGLPGMYGPDYLVEKGIILVTVNYRLNIQGFLCLGIKEAPGNAGLKDQVAALRWVQDNIVEFGGNPDDVTLTGESAGGASVAFHLLSPMSKGLFHKAIIQSGSSLAAWTNQYNPVYMASLLAKTMLYNSQDPHELYKFFMAKTDRDLIMTRVPRKQGNTIISELLYTPCVEKEIPGVEPFITKNPFDLLSRGEFHKVPIMIGSMSEEGLLFVGMENATTLSEMTVEKSLPKDLVFPTEKERKAAAAELEKILFSDKGISPYDLVAVSKIHGEPYFNYPIAKETELLARSNDKPVYSYKFSYNGYLNTPKRLSGFAGTPGATHADELFYLYKPRSFPTPYRYLEGAMIDKLTTLWTNFAKYGNPTPQLSELLPVRWNRTSRDDPRVFVIDEPFSTEPLWARDSDSMRFWRDVYDKYRRKY